MQSLKFLFFFFFYFINEICFIFYFTDVTENYDCVFWFGDLNFRLSQPREKLIEWVLQEDFPTALEGDQLNNSRTQGIYLNYI